MTMNVRLVLSYLKVGFYQINSGHIFIENLHFVFMDLVNDFKNSGKSVNTCYPMDNSNVI